MQIPSLGRPPAGVRPTVTPPLPHAMSSPGDHTTLPLADAPPAALHEPRLRAVEAALLDRVPELLVEWQAITQEEPWLSLPREHRLDSLPEVVRGIIALAFGAERALVRQPAGHAAATAAALLTEARTHLETAATHGAHRRGLALPQDLILREYYLLREALLRICRRVGEDATDVALVYRLDTALHVVTRASLFGYHRAEAEAVQSWPALIDRLAREAVVQLARSPGVVPPNKLAAIHG